MGARHSTIGDLSRALRVARPRLHSPGSDLTWLRVLVMCALPMCAAVPKAIAKDCRPCPSKAAGCVQGTVEDQTGGYLPLAEIRMISSQEGQGEEGPPDRGTVVKSDPDDGRFFITDLPPGQYRVEVELPEFSTGKLGPVHVRAGRTLHLGFVTLPVRGSRGPEYTMLSTEPSLCPEEQATPEASYATRWSTPEAVSDWVRLLGDGGGEATRRVLSEDETTFVRVQPPQFVLSQPDVLHVMAANWPASHVSSGGTHWDPQTAGAVVDPGKHSGVRLRVRHNTPFRFISGFWVQRTLIQEPIGEPNYAGMPSFRGHRILGDGNWHDVSFWFSESPYFQASEPIVLLVFAFSGQDGMTIDEESPGWKAFETAHDRLRSEHYCDVESIELLKR